MEEIENIVRYISSNFDEDTIKMINFIERANILTSNIKMNSVRKDENTVVEKPSNILEISYLRMCSEELEGYDLLGEMFLYYQDYVLRDLRYSWKFNLDNMEREFSSKCSYCNISCKHCPMKVLGYIKKKIKENNINECSVFDRLMNTDSINYFDDRGAIDYVVEKILEVTNNKLVVAGAEFLLQTKSVDIQKEENGILYYRYLDFHIKDKSFINGLYDFFVNRNGVWGEFSLNEPRITENFSYMFSNSPIEVAVYLSHLCKERNIDPIEVLKILYRKIKTDEDITKIAYYNQYMKYVDNLDCSDNVKDNVKDVLNYIRNYYNNGRLPYIQFNIGLFTKNNVLIGDIVSILNRYARTFYYILEKNLLFVDAEKLVKTTRDSNDVFFHMEKIYEENDFIIFTNIDKIKNLNEHRVDSFFLSIEKNYYKHKKAIVVFAGEKDIIEDITKNYLMLNTVIINKRIDIEKYDVEKIKEKIIKKLGLVTEFDEEFRQELYKYIENTYNPKAIDENTYIQDVCNSIIFNKFKIISKDKSLQKDKLPELKGSRELNDILDDLNKLVGLTEVKYRVNEMLRYIEYNDKSDNKYPINFNMVFKGNAGTGKTSVAKLIAELLHKQKIIKSNKVVEVISKDLIGDHLGQTGPKTQSVIDSALDGVLFIDEANALGGMIGTTANYSGECIATLCKSMDLYKDRLVVIFAGQTKEMNDFLYRNQGLTSRVGYQIEFTDFSKEELYEIFKNKVYENGFEIGEGVEHKINQIIGKNKVIRNFGNARFVDNLFEKLILTHVMQNEDAQNLKLLTAVDVDKMEERIKDKERGIEEILRDLNSLIGLRRD